MLALLKAAVAARLNIVISGGTGAGKTTLLNVLSGYISAKERIVTIEDSAELQLKQRHVVRLECRPANAEGKGAVQARQLVINSLRMRPNRIVVGEVRGEEALDMLQAMNTGHDGSHDHDSRQQSARRSRPHGNHGHDGEPELAGKGHSKTDRIGGYFNSSGCALQRRNTPSHTRSPKSPAWKVMWSACRICLCSRSREFHPMAA